MRLPSLETLSIWSQEPLPASEGEMPESGSDEVQRKEAEGLVERQKAKIDAQTAEIVRLRSSKERYARRYRETKERITELDLEFREVRRDHEEALEKRDRRVQAATDELAQIKDELQRTKDELARTKDELTQAKEPPAGGSTEPAETQHQSSSSMTHSPSEGEVLGVVRDLNEIIFQVAANLTEEWEKRGSSWYSRPNLTKEEVDSLSQFYGPTLLRQALGRDPTAMTFLVQSCLCYLVAQIALSWRRDHDSRLWALGSVYKRLSASEDQETSARWRSLTQKHLPTSPFHPTSIVHHLADVFWITGSFPSTQDSFDFVKAKAFNGIETVNRLAARLESLFMADITSSDMCLLFETPRTDFDDTRMEREYESGEAFIPGRQNKVAGTTEVGVERSVCGARGEVRRTEVLLKAKVVLEKDLANL